MTDFEKARLEYETCFGQRYPYLMGYGYPGRFDDDNIEIIRRCIDSRKPVVFKPYFRNDEEAIV